MLGKLQRISDARSGAAPSDQASALGHRGDGTQRHHGKQIPGVNSKGYADTAPPPDVDLDCIGKDGPPRKEFSLWAHYVWRFDAAAQDANRAQKANDRDGWNRAILHMDSLCSQALRDLLLYTGEYRRPTADPADTSDRANSKNVQELLTEYRGVPAHEAAVWLMCSVVWVKKSRRNSGFDAELGEDKIRDQRTLKVLQLKESKMTVRAIAEEVGMSRSAVDRILQAA